MLAIGGAVAGIVALVLTAPFVGEETIVEVSYDRLLAGAIVPGEAMASVEGLELQLVSALDPGDEAFGFYQPQPGHRLIVFSFLITNRRDEAGDLPSAYIEAGDFALDDGTGDERGPLVAVIDRLAPPVQLDPGYTAPADVVFEVPMGRTPLEISFNQGAFFSDTAVFRFR